MDQTRFAVMTRLLRRIPSRRDVLRGLVGAGLGLGFVGLADPAEAKKKHKRKKKKKRSAKASRRSAARNASRRTSATAAVQATRCAMPASVIPAP